MPGAVLQTSASDFTIDVSNPPLLGTKVRCVRRKDHTQKEKEHTHTHTQKEKHRNIKSSDLLVKSTTVVALPPKYESSI
jgi:hypothetical protein